MQDAPDDSYDHQSSLGDVSKRKNIAGHLMFPRQVSGGNLQETPNWWSKNGFLQIFRSTNPMNVWMSLATVQPASKLPGKK